MNDPAPAPDATSLDDDLATLRQQSRDRQEALAAIAATLPIAQSRRALFRQMVSDLSRAPDKLTVARRVVGKLFRLPADLLRRIVQR